MPNKFKYIGADEVINTTRHGYVSKGQVCQMNDDEARNIKQHALDTWEPVDDKEKEDPLSADSPEVIAAKAEAAKAAAAAAKAAAKAAGAK